MLPIEDYCDMIDKRQPDFIEQLVRDGRCQSRPRIPKQSIDDLSAVELENYEEVREHYKKRYLNNWRQTISSECRYRKPHLVNVEHLEKPSAHIMIQESSDDKVFVFPCFVRPGKHCYAVRSDPTSSETQVELSGRDQDSLNDSFADKFFSEFFSHTMIAPCRSEEIPGYMK